MAKNQDKAQSSKVWSIFSMVAAMVAATATKKSLDVFWKAATGKKPPKNPADPQIALPEAVAWVGLSGTLVAVARMLASRRAADYYARSTGHLPPGMGTAPAEEPAAS